MEEGSFVQQVATQQRGESLPLEQEEEEEETLALEQAAPEDFKQVMSLWKSIVAETSGRFRVVLASAVPKYNVKGDDQRLYVVFADFLAEPYINNREKQEELEKIIASKLGKRVEVRMILQADESQLKGGRLSKIGLEDAIRKFVHADISIED